MASKWLHLPLLIDVQEMSSLLDHLGEVYLFSTMGVQPVGKNTLFREQFLEAWQQYIASLRSEKIDEHYFRFFMTLALTKTVDAVVFIDAGDGREMIRPVLPVVQTQMHRFSYSTEDKKFRSMVFGPNTISWGIQFSYPQLFQDPVQRNIEQALNERFVNSTLFRALQEWVRRHTVPTPFFVEGKKVNVPIRLGKNCFSWINTHHDLVKRGLTVSHGY